MFVYEKYLRHYQLDGIRPTYPSLLELYRSFTRIPYENASKIISKHATRDRLRLPEKLFEEHIRFGTGGTCFSLVYALFKLLKYIRYDAFLVLADRSYGENTHTAVMVRLESGCYLLDPGYLVPVPVRIPEIGFQTTIALPMNDLVLENMGDTMPVSTVRENTMTCRYILKNRAVPESEFRLVWESSFEMKMMERVCMTKLIPKGQLYLRQNRVEVISREKREKYYIEEGYGQKVYDLFGISPRITEALLRWHNLKK